MVRTLLASCGMWLVGLSAMAADAIWFNDAPGQDLYVRVRTSATTSVFAALDEGTSNSVGFYYVAEAMLVSAGLSAAGTYPYKIFVGATPSASADDLQVGTGVLAWSGSAALPAGSNVTHWRSDSVPTSDTAGYPKVTVKSGTGTGELNIASGVVDGDLRQILGSTQTENEPGDLVSGLRALLQNELDDGPNGASANLLLVIEAATSLMMLPSASGIAQAGSSTTITLASTASAVDDFYIGSTVQIVNGAGRGQSRVISAYVGLTREATLSTSWATAPTSGSLYAVWP